MSPNHFFASVGAPAKEVTSHPVATTEGAAGFSVHRLQVSNQHPSCCGHRHTRSKMASNKATRVSEKSVHTAFFSS